MKNFKTRTEVPFKNEKKIRCVVGPLLFYLFILLLKILFCNVRFHCHLSRVWLNTFCCGFSVVFLRLRKTVICTLLA